MSLLDISGLTVVYPSKKDMFEAVKEVSLSLRPGEILGIVGESGAGKSTIATAVTRLIEYPGFISEGSINLSGTDILRLPTAEIEMLRGRRIGVIFQDPLTALNPVLTIGLQLMETIRVHHGLQGNALRARAIDLLEQVGITDAENRLRQYPHQFSGGMRQRVVISIALAGEPELLLADEPTTALDVSIQSEILHLIQNLCRSRKLGVILITHDMAVINEVADRVAVMLNGRVIEVADTREIIDKPEHPYTKSLVAAVPRTDVKLERFELMENFAENQGASSDADMQKKLSWFDGLGGNKYLDSKIVSVKNISVRFLQNKSLIKKFNRYLYAVDDVSFEINEGETFGLVGESGSGKSTVARTIIGLQKPLLGEVHYNGKNITNISEDSSMRKNNIDMQIIFQDPFSSLNPRMKVREIISEPVIHHGMATSEQARELVTDILRRVGLDVRAGERYPHQFSGGQRQRIAIARALLMRPKFLICDEPTSALDVSIQASLLNLLKDLQDDLGLTILFISHDLAVIRQMCDRVGVMRNGKLCEVADCQSLFESPSHSYTKKLLELMPKFSREVTV